MCLRQRNYFSYTCSFCFRSIPTFILIVVFVTEKFTLQVEAMKIKRRFLYLFPPDQICRRYLKKTDRRRIGLVKFQFCLHLKLFNHWQVVHLNCLWQCQIEECFKGICEVIEMQCNRLWTQQHCKLPRESCCGVTWFKYLRFIFNGKGNWNHDKKAKTPLNILYVAIALTCDLYRCRQLIMKWKTSSFLGYIFPLAVTCLMVDKIMKKKMRD